MSDKYGDDVYVIERNFRFKGSTILFKIKENIFEIKSNNWIAVVNVFIKIAVIRNIGTKWQFSGATPRIPLIYD